jgi:replication factor C subunit 2/4
MFLCDKILLYKNKPLIENRMNLKKNIPWVEKYRPNTIDDILDQNEITKVLKKCIKKNGNIPHMLFHGSPGTGKSSTAAALGHQLFGKKYYSERVMELNASDERGIKVVREKIKDFAKKKIQNVTIKNYNHLCPDYKIIILDEADALTDDSQFALRRIIEKYSETTRFFLICNFISKINNALISRCAKFCFKSLSNTTVVQCLRKISKEENFNIGLKEIKRIIAYSGGDLRKSIITLQRLSFISTNTNNNEIIENLTIMITKEKFDYLVDILNKNDTYENVKMIASYFTRNSYDCQLVLNEMNKNIVDSNFNNLQKLFLFLKLSDLDYLINNGSSDEIILINFFTYLAKILKKYK